MPAIADARVLIIATDGFEQAELFGPLERLREAGADVTLASLRTDPIQGMVHDEKGRTITPDTLIADVDADDYDALVIPGGVANPDKLRTDEATVALVQAFDDAGKPVAAICHGPWLLVEADMVEDRTVTSWPSLRTDLENAGGEWEDEQVVVDGNIITSRKPDDVPAFNEALIRLIEQGVEED
ncbi:type 1 glutamine amidotransferase domain-containing protein [Sphingomonas jatrophae]|uniref:Protease I n=1 Tax=Sphingomonas jatrophae TaxID=1166337 RepID=A0A1I6LHD5_9SPHN|nr:type 1 glutamine amidotransferase domain-containing protein [Sphingomonas jatrophae]SFS02871.1 protease I [Sphingomonas jatrophae]